jgi:ribonuclease-3
MKPERLEAALGHGFGRPELLRQALTHRSFGSPHNERLEFLGDSVLNCVVADNLFRRFPLVREGKLHLLRVSLVRQAALAEIALRLQLGDYLLMDKNALMSGSARSPAVLSDAMEAVFGAIFLDAGFEQAHRVISTLYAKDIELVNPDRLNQDPKTELQQILHQRLMVPPVYRLVATRGEDHTKEFDVECEIAPMSIRTIGSGRSRRIAEQQAAQRALVEIKT